MPVITMNVPCTVSTKIGTDVYGATKYSDPTPARCAVIKLSVTSQHSTVRADSGATRGHADEVVADAILLMSKNVEPQHDSKIVLRGKNLRIIGVRARYDVMSRLDHYEVRCEIE